jgi:CheY-like chemotaxis protein
MDDDIMVRELLTQILSHLGYEVEEAENGESTLEKYEDARMNGNPIDMIIMDLTIPGGMGGKETIKALLDIDPDVKAIVSSGYSNDPIMASYREYGFIGVLNKPYNVETLSSALQKYMPNKITT